MVHATAGLIPAIVVIKNEKNVMTKLYAVQSPIEPMVYPNILDIFNLFSFTPLFSYFVICATPHLPYTSNPNSVKMEYAFSSDAKIHEILFCF